jgi:hypothetical protein
MCGTKRKLTMKDYVALVKQSSIKGDGAIAKNCKDIIQQLKDQIEGLRNYWPNVIRDAIHKHSLATSIDVNATLTDVKVDDKSMLRCRVKNGVFSITLKIHQNLKTPASKIFVT